MKKIKIVVGIIIAIASITVLTETLRYEHGAGLGGGVFGFLIIACLAIWLIYSGISVEKSNEKKDSYIIKASSNTISSRNDKSKSLKQNLERLKEGGIITADEYNSKLNQVNERDFDERLKKSTDYIQLKDLFDSGFFDKLEFENKISAITKRLKTELNNNEVDDINSFDSIRYKKIGLSFKMGVFKEYVVELVNGKTYNIYHQKSTNKYYISVDNKNVLFPNKETCIDYIERNF